MGISNEIPFFPESASVPTSLEGGWALGQEFVDSRTSYKYRLYQISSDLNNDAFADGECAVFETDGVVTNKAANYEDTTYPAPAGFACAAYPESTGSTTVRYALFLVEGLKTVLTDTGDDIVKGDLLVADETANGKVDRLAKASDGITTNGVVRTIVGRARANDTATSVLAAINLLFR